LGWVHDEARPTLRPQYGLAGGNAVGSMEKVRPLRETIL
jgi:hypothetical protein